MRDDVWHAGEDAAWAVYRGRGFRLLARNWRCRLGELDLVLARGDMIVFCEVKARRGSAFAFESVTPAKVAKVRAVAGAFLRVVRPAAAAYRFDVASIGIDRAGRASVHLFEDAF